MAIKIKVSTDGQDLKGSVEKLPFGKESMVLYGVDPGSTAGEMAIGIVSMVDSSTGQKTVLGEVTNMKFEPTPTQSIAEAKPKKVGSFLSQKLAEKQQAETQQATLPVVQTTQVQITDAVGAQVEELIDLDTRMKAAGAYEMTKRLEELKKSLQAAVADWDPTQPAHLHCASGVVVFSECRHETKITNKPELIKLMGTQEYIEASKVTLADAKKYLSEIELAKVTTVGFGSRSLKSVTVTPTDGEGDAI